MGMLLLNMAVFVCLSQVWMDSKFARQESSSSAYLAASPASHEPVPVFTWERVGPSGAMELSWPQQRDRHAVCCHNGWFYLVGGRSGGVSYSDFWSWNPSELLLFLCRSCALTIVLFTL